MGKVSEKREATLLEKALLGRAQVPGLYMSPEAKEEADLFVAWADGTLDSSDIQRVMDIKTSGQIATRAGTVLRNAVKGGYLKITRADSKEGEE